MAYNFSGVALPWGISVKDFIAPKEDKEILKSSIFWIVMTRKRERLMLPEFGTVVPTSVFEPNDAALQDQIRTDVKEAIKRWDDRITFVEMGFEAVESQLNCKLLYKNALDPLQETQTAQFTLVLA